jgi:hypothetical protein
MKEVKKSRTCPYSDTICPCEAVCETCVIWKHYNKEGLK